MTDTELQTYMPHQGDRVSTRAYAARLLNIEGAQGPATRTSNVPETVSAPNQGLATRARDVLETVSAPNQSATAPAGSQSGDRKTMIMKRIAEQMGMGPAGEVSKQRSWEKPASLAKVKASTKKKKVKPGANASKEDLKIDIGFSNYDKTTDRYKQVRRPNGGGIRELHLQKPVGKQKIIDEARDAFFPEGTGTHGMAKDFTFDLAGDVAGKQEFKEFENAFEFMSRLKMKKMRCYLLARKIETTSSDDSMSLDGTEDDFPNQGGDLGISADVSSVEPCDEPPPSIMLNNITTNDVLVTSEVLDCQQLLIVSNVHHSTEVTSSLTEISEMADSHKVTTGNTHTDSAGNPNVTNSLAALSDEVPEMERYKSRRGTSQVLNAEQVGLDDAKGGEEVLVVPDTPPSSLDRILQEVGKRSLSVAAGSSSSIFDDPRNFQESSKEVGQHYSLSVAPGSSSLIFDGPRNFQESSEEVEKQSSTPTAGSSSLIFEDPRNFQESVDEVGQQSLFAAAGSSSSIFEDPRNFQESSEDEPLAGMGTTPTHPVTCMDTIRLHRGNVLAELRDYYKTHDVKNPIYCKMILPNGQEEAAEDNGGVLRDALSEFWEEFYEMNTVGETVKVPSTRHNMEKEDWEACGKVLLIGYRQERYFPVQLATCFLEYCMGGDDAVTKELLVDTFLDYLPDCERDVLERARKDFDDVSGSDELLDVQSDHKIRVVVTASNLEEVLKQVAQKELVQDAAYVGKCWHAVFSNELQQLLDVSFAEMRKRMIPTTQNVLKLCKFPDSLNEAMKDTADMLKKYIKGLPKACLGRFLRFITGKYYL